MSLERGILGFLSMRPMSGYDIKKLFDLSAAYFWPADQTQIYRTLKKLSKDGLVEFQGHKKGQTVDRKVYAVTESGRGALLRAVRDNTATDFLLREPYAMQLFLSGELSREDQLKLIDTQLENNGALLREVEESFTQSRDTFVELVGLPAGDRRYQSALWARQWGVTRVRAYSEFLTQIKRELLKESSQPHSSDYGEDTK